MCGLCRVNWSNMKPLNRSQVSALEQHDFDHAPTKAEITILAAKYHIRTAHLPGIMDPSSPYRHVAPVQVINHYKLKMKKRAQHTLTRRTSTRSTRQRAYLDDSSSRCFLLSLGMLSLRVFLSLCPPRKGRKRKSQTESEIAAVEPKRPRISFTIVR